MSQRMERRNARETSADRENSSGVKINVENLAQVVLKSRVRMIRHPDGDERMPRENNLLWK